jgi:cellulose biosynthesis protein BcsQ
LVDALLADLEACVVGAGTVLRDASGSLAFFTATELPDEVVERASTHIRERLGAYARRDRVIADRRAVGADRVLSDPTALAVTVGSLTLRYLDRRVVGTDWQMGASLIQERPPRFVFASLKGGVGRSTALSVVAAEAARQGRNVLVVDLDLEAPGIGSMLLTEDRLPDYGTVDYLVEANLSPIAGVEIDALTGTSPLTAGAGLVNVAPVFGKRTLAAPENYLAKVSRAMTEAVLPHGQRVPLREKISGLLESLEARRRYDIVLVDSRAGLAELTAGPLLGLGATVLLFGTAQRQTLEGLRMLLAHLRSLPTDGPPLRALKMVHAKAHHEPSLLAFKDDLWDLFSEYVYEEQDGIEGFNFGPDDPAAPHDPILIPLDPAFADWDPTAEPSKLLEPYYTRSFGDLLKYVADSLPVDKA